jgi:hypothetical protein
VEVKGDETTCLAIELRDIIFTVAKVTMVTRLGATMRIWSTTFTFNNAKLTQDGETTQHETLVIRVKDGECPDLFATLALEPLMIGSEIQFNIERGEMDGQEVLHKTVTISATSAEIS